VGLGAGIATFNKPCLPICCVAVISLQQDKGAGKENLWRNLWVEEAGAMV